MVFMIRRSSSQLPLNPFLKSIFGLYIAASPLACDRVVRKVQNVQTEAALQSGGVSLEARWRVSHSGRRPESELARLSEGISLTRLKPGRQHKGRTAAHNARDKSMGRKWKSEAKRRK